MMSETTHFAIWATDRLGMADERARVREAHRARLREGKPGQLKVVLGGPTTDEVGAMNGSLLVVEASDIAAVRDFIAGDPYVLSGVYDTVEVRRWQWGLGRIA